MGVSWIFKASTKAGAALGSLFIVREYNLFASTYRETREGCDSLKKALTSSRLYKDLAATPYVSDVPQVVDELSTAVPALPDVQNVKTTFRHYWNSGVLASFSALASLPRTVTSYTGQAVTFAVSKWNVERLEPEEVTGEGSAPPPAPGENEVKQYIQKQEEEEAPKVKKWGWF